MKAKKLSKFFSKYSSVFVGVIVTIVLIGVLGLFARLDPLGGLFSLFGGGKTTIITGDAIIDKIEAVSELTTTKYTIQLVVKGEKRGDIIPIVEAKVLLVAKGMVAAGLDMAKLDESAVDVSEDGESVTVNLPPVKILNRDYVLSSNKDDTYVFTEERLVTANATGLETQVRSTAADKILEAACKDGIMDVATKDAKLAIEQLLKTFVPNVTVVSAPVPSVEECMAK